MVPLKSHGGELECALMPDDGEGRRAGRAAFFMPLFSGVRGRVILRSWAAPEGLALWRATFLPYHRSARGREGNILSQMRQVRHPNSARIARPRVPPGSPTGEHPLPAPGPYG